ncbi:MAG: hypothetical protein AAB308_06105, partial [Nitrospirota bacterium]
ANRSWTARFPAHRLVNTTDRQRSRRRVMRLAVILILSLLGGCTGLTLDKTSDRTGSLSNQEREALHQQAREGAQQSREQYLSTTRPALQRKFRQEYPTMTEADLELLVNDALEKGLRTEAGRRPDGPIRQPQMDCMSSSWRNSAFSNCY